MRRRRFLSRRAFAQPTRFAPLDPISTQELSRANNLMLSGNYVDAAPIFDRLAENTLEKGMIRRAPFLYYKASRAYFLSGQIDTGKERLFKCLNTLFEGQRWQILQSFCYRSIFELEQMKLLEIAKSVKDWQADAFHKSSHTYLSIEDVDAKEHPNLPTKCPYCGATLLPNEYERIDQNSIECAYCGSLIRN
jgi:uncharacterized Zn-finger protein